MNLSSTFRATLSVATTLSAFGACSSGVTDPTVVALDPTALLSVQPAGGTANVSVGTTVVVTFNHAIAQGMEEYAVLHQDSLTGPVVDGAWTLSTDQTQLIFTPAAALKPATTFVIHIGGGMMDEDGHVIDLDMHGTGMGGQWATQTMMTAGGGMGGMMGGGTGGMAQYMGTGWANPTNGTYGMVFTFTTAG